MQVSCIHDLLVRNDEVALGVASPSGIVHKYPRLTGKLVEYLLEHAIHIGFPTYVSLNANRVAAKILYLIHYGKQL